MILFFNLTFRNIRLKMNYETDEFESAIVGQPPLLDRRQSVQNITADLLQREKDKVFLSGFDPKRVGLVSFRTT